MQVASNLYHKNFWYNLAEPGTGVISNICYWNSFAVYIELRMFYLNLG